MGAYLPHGTPCEQTSASEGNTSVTSSAPLVLGHGTEVAAAEAGQSTALVLEAPATASSLAPPPSAHTGSEHRGQPSERPRNRHRHSWSGQKGGPVERGMVYNHCRR